MILITVVVGVAAFVAGVLFGRRNVQKVEAALAEAKKLLEEAKKVVSKK